MNIFYTIFKTGHQSNSLRDRKRYLAENFDFLFIQNIELYPGFLAIQQPTNLKERKRYLVEHFDY